MRHLKIIVISLLSFAFLGGAIWFLVNYLKPEKGGISVNTTPVSSVYIDDKFVGKTPYEAVFPTGELSLKLVPEAGDKGSFVFETVVNIVAGTKTVVRREFGESNNSDSGFIVSFEKGIKDETTLIVISKPDNAQVIIDGIAKGFTPYKLGKLTPGEHNVILKSIGFNDKELTVNLVPDHRLSIIADLEKNLAPIVPEVAAIETEIKSFIEINDTPTGFLRVRTEPGSGGGEIYQVKPGEKYLFLEEDTVTGWYKIQVQDSSPGLPDGIVGWVSNQYSKKIEE